ncbi:MAG: malate synthase A [Acidobacteriota bacterium]
MIATAQETCVEKQGLVEKPTQHHVWEKLAAGVEVSRGAKTPAALEVLTEPAVALVATLHRRLDAERRELLADREHRQAAIDGGELPRYPDLCSEAVIGNWRVAPIPPDLKRRRVEITGPVNHAKMVINMLSRNAAGDRADTAMLDFEDSMKPTWQNVIDGVHNVKQAAEGTLTYVKRGADGEPESIYALDPEDSAVMMVRVRGLHLEESNLRVDGQPVCGGLMDLALTLLHAGQPLIARGRTPKFYVPKCEHHLEARWWNQLFRLAQTELGMAVGTLRATFLIETLPAAFQMEEILYEIREHAAGLNVGRWDKIFSDIKVLRRHPDRVLADRGWISMERPWMRAYAERLVQVCHRRGAFAIGGMAAFTPGKSAQRRDEQTAKVLADKQLEASLGHDGCWVSHPYFIGAALSAFERDNQLDVIDPEANRYPDLLPQPTGPRTLAGLRTNLRVGIGYLEGWSRGIGCVAWDDLMEDLATLEISRAQVWQWLAHGVRLDDGTAVTEALVRGLFAEELEQILGEIREAMAGASAETVERTERSFVAAKEEAERVFLRDELSPFLAKASDLVV